VGAAAVVHGGLVAATNVHRTARPRRPLVAPWRVRAELLADPAREALSVRVFVAPDELVDVRVVEALLVETRCELAHLFDATRRKHQLPRRDVGPMALRDDIEAGVRRRRWRLGLRRLGKAGRAERFGHYVGIVLKVRRIGGLALEEGGHAVCEACDRSRRCRVRRAFAAGSPKHARFSFFSRPVLDVRSCM